MYLPEHNAAFIFLPNLNADNIDPGAELASGCHLSRATVEQADRIKDFMLRFFGSDFLDFKRLIWEADCVQDGSGVKFSYLPPEQWKYTVLVLTPGCLKFFGFSKPAGLLIALEQAFAFYEPAPRLAAMFFPDRGVTVGPNVHADFGADTLPGRLPGPPFFDQISMGALQKMVDTMSILRAYRHEVFDIRMAMESVVQLQGIPVHIPLRFLGFYGVLESLLTHAPDRNDPNDSIGKQIRNKFKLLNNRFEHRIECAYFAKPEHFKGESSVNRLWTAMYSYRSALAHGGSPNFKDNNLQILKGPGEALQLITHTTKAVMRHALKEPQLLADLRDC